MVDLCMCFGINLLPSSLVVSHQQENGFLLCSVKLGENNFNKRSSCHKKYKTATKCALIALNGKLTTLSTLNF